ncbi:cholesterol 25-hydroxylase [Coccidioides immitis H538.4]|uniref:Cholesterol 25-hydroxylase n=2 Tax=Coccidioides immitis TaxID=5501 RepID=A0A0J8S5E7_COCIT|nr:cholesterol 25-hydroxylase [Coccidioides immitis RMSCC 2394]KMU92397.1 cholesterol 25-hydroxylase [Coccidioides immitis H538.4]
MTIPLSVWFPRVILLAIVCTGILWPSAWQPVVSALYRYLYTWPFFNRSFFETVETVLCYITIEPIYTARFARNPSRRIDVRDGANSGNKARPKLPKMKRPSRRLRELLIYVSPLLLLDLTLIKKYAGVDINAIRLVRALPHEPPTSRRVLLELAVSLFIYDALFFVIHIAFHRIRALHRIHGPHHGHLEIHPQVTNRLSVAERVSLILLANFSLNIIGSHVLTRTLFVPVFVYLLIEVHSGVDLDWQYDKILPQGWGAGPRKHALHHREGKRFYQPFFCWWDNWLESLEGARID